MLGERPTTQLRSQLRKHSLAANFAAFFCFDFDQPLSLFPELFGFDVCAEIRPFLLPVVRANSCPNFLHSSTAIRSAALCAVGPTARRLNLFSFSFLALYAHFFVLVSL
jgi:hypothetical protein